MRLSEFKSGFFARPLLPFLQRDKGFLFSAQIGTGFLQKKSVDSVFFMPFEVYGKMCLNPYPTRALELHSGFEWGAGASCPSSCSSAVIVFTPVTVRGTG